LNIVYRSLHSVTHVTVRYIKHLSVPVIWDNRQSLILPVAFAYLNNRISEYFQADFRLPECGGGYSAVGPGCGVCPGYLPNTMSTINQSINQSVIFRVALVTEITTRSTKVL